MSIYGTDEMDVHYKDPQAKLDYQWDWAGENCDGGPWLAEGETIVSAVVTVPAGLTRPVDHPTDILTATTVTVWLTGGDVAATYRVTCHIVTNQGREDERTKKLVIRER